MRLAASTLGQSEEPLGLHFGRVVAMFSASTAKRNAASFCILSLVAVDLAVQSTIVSLQLTIASLLSSSARFKRANLNLMAAVGYFAGAPGGPEKD